MLGTDMLHNGSLSSLPTPALRPPVSTMLPLTAAAELPHVKTASEVSPVECTRNVKYASIHVHLNVHVENLIIGL